MVNIQISAGTPKKSKPVEEAPTSSGTSDKDTLKLPSDQLGSGSLLNRTPARKSYAPVIPSPLLQVRGIGPDRQNFQRRIIVNIFLAISFNMCFGCSKELSH